MFQADFVQRESDGEAYSILTSRYYEDMLQMQKIGPLINAGFLSDEACEEGWFTGAMIGICCQDLNGFGKYADFDYFEIK